MNTTHPLLSSPEYQSAIEFLTDTNASLANGQLAQINCLVLNESRFLYVPGSVKHHHATVGGLVRHTAEVARTAQAMSQLSGKLDWNILFTAAVWHDYGKVYDYAEGLPGEFTYTPHRYSIRHLPRSYAEFMSVSSAVPDAIRDAISHCILSHHGRLDWGAALEPASPEAWALHLADMVSVKCIDLGNTH